MLHITFSLLIMTYSGNVQKTIDVLKCETTNLIPPSLWPTKLPDLSLVADKMLNVLQQWIYSRKSKMRACSCDSISHAPVPDRQCLNDNDVNVFAFVSLRKTVISNNHSSTSSKIIMLHVKQIPLIVKKETTFIQYSQRTIISACIQRF